MTTASTPSSVRAPVAWVALLAALFVEYGALAVAFDVAPWLRHVQLEQLRLVRHFGPALLTGLVATLVVGGRELATDVRDTLGAAGSPSRRGLWLALHAAAFAALVALSAHMFLPPFPPRSEAPVLIVAWLALGTLALVLLVRGLIRFRPLATLLRRNVRHLVLGATMAVLAHQAGALSERLWTYTARPTIAVFSTVAGWLLPMVSQPEEQLLGTERFLVQVAPACSGYEGVGLIAIFIGGYIAIFRRSLHVGAALAVLPLGMAVMWIANVLRIVLLLVVGHYVSPRLALDGFHANLGWLLFLLTALTFVTWLDRSPRFQRAQRAVPATTSGSNPTPGYLLPLMAVIFVSLITDLVALELDWLYGARVVAGGVVLFVLRKHLPSPTWRFAWEPIALGLAVLVMWLLLVPNAPANPEALAALQSAAPAQRVTWIALHVLGSVLLVPLVEELAFRAYLQRRVQSEDFLSVPLDRWAWGPVIITSLAFGMLHQQWIAGSLAGIAFAYAQARRGAIGDAVVAHAVANLGLAVAVLAADRWDLWLG